MSQHVSKSRFKAKALQYFRQVEETRKEMIVTDRGRPVVRIVPVDNPIAVKSVFLPPPLHNDPADRIIVATALILGATLVTRDDRLRQYLHLQTLW